MRADTGMLGQRLHIASQALRSHFPEIYTSLLGSLTMDPSLKELVDEWLRQDPVSLFVIDVAAFVMRLDAWARIQKHAKKFRLWLKRATFSSWKSE